MTRRGYDLKKFVEKVAEIQRIKVGEVLARARQRERLALESLLFLAGARGERWAARETLEFTNKTIL